MNQLIEDSRENTFCVLYDVGALVLPNTWAQWHLTSILVEFIIFIFLWTLEAIICRPALPPTQITPFKPAILFTTSSEYEEILFKGAFLKDASLPKFG